MNRIALYFGNNKLYRVELQHHLLSSPVVSMRGKTPRGRGASASFQWTRAVHALSVLLLKGALRQVTTEEGQLEAAIEGERNSFAASLDYALGRRPAWLTEMFGFTHTKRSILNLLFVRSNPEQRVPGPVSVALRPRAWSEMKIEVFEYSRQLRERGELTALLARLDPELNSALEIRDREVPRTPCAEMYESLREILRPAYRAEVLRSLTATNPLSPDCLKSCVRNFMANPSLTRRLGRKVNEFGMLLRSVDTTTRLGLDAYRKDVVERIHEAGEIQVVAPVVFAASQALFTYLKHWRGLPLQILDQYPHAVESSAQLAKGNFAVPPDFVMQGLGPAITVMKSSVGSEYSPFMMMPEGRITLLTAGREDVPLNGLRHLYLLNDEPSSPLFLLENLIRDFGYRGDASHEELDASIQRLRSAEKGEASILMFPFNYLVRRYSESFECNAPRGSVTADYLLFASKRITSQPKLANAFEIVIRDAWLELISNTALRNAVVDKLLSSEQHLRVISRGSGLVGESGALPVAA